MTSWASLCPVATLPEAEGARDKATGQGNHSPLFSFFGLLSFSLRPRTLPLKTVTEFSTLFLWMSSEIEIPSPPPSPSLLPPSPLPSPFPFPFFSSPFPSPYPFCSWAELGAPHWELHSRVFRRKKKNYFKLPPPVAYTLSHTSTHSHVRTHTLSPSHTDMHNFFPLPHPSSSFESATLFFARTLGKALREQPKKSAPASFLRVK